MSAPQLYKVIPLTAAEVTFLKSLSPAVKENGVTITTTMYNHMFANYPSVKPFFNMTNQYTKRQPKVLAFSLYAYLTHLDNLGPIVPFVNQIVVKHCGLDIMPEQYKVVEKCLNYAFDKVFGDVLDDKFYTVFGKAYGNLAQLLINAEYDYYSKLQWRGFKDFEVSKLVKECEDVTSVYLTPVDGTILKAGSPGQYLGLRWNVPGQENESSREYSISDVLDETDNTFRISVRLIPGGIVSTYVNQVLKEGDVIKATAPVGKFTYNAESEKNKVAIFAGGIGSTPMVTILKSALNDGKSVKFYYSNREPKTIAFESLLKSLQEKYSDKFELIEYVSSEGRRLSEKDIDLIDDSYDAYVLGPVEYMDFVKGELEHKGVKNIYLEYFGPTKV